MPITHAFSSAQAAATNRALVDGPRWNAAHLITLGSVAVSASGTTPNTTEVEEVTTGSSSLARTLPSAVANPGMVIRLIKVDSGSGSVTYTDAASANVGLGPSYVLSNPGQYAVLQASTVSGNWNVLGNN